MDGLVTLTAESLRRIASALERGALTPPFGRTSLAPFVAADACLEASESLRRLAESGASAASIALTLRGLVQREALAHRATTPPQLVFSGPAPSGEGRDTSVVVRELFEHAEEDVLVVGFTAKNGEAVFAPLAERWMARPKLRVRIALNVGRGDPKDQRSESQILSDFREELRTSIWPWTPIPEFFYDPRALRPFDGPRAVLHAKTVMVDGLTALVTSANFTEAAQERNIEVGVLVRDAVFASSIWRHFDALVALNHLVQLDVRR